MTEKWDKKVDYELQTLQAAADTAPHNTPWTIAGKGASSDEIELAGQLLRRLERQDLVCSRGTRYDVTPKGFKKLGRAGKAALEYIGWRNSEPSPAAPLDEFIAWRDAKPAQGDRG